MLIVVGIVIVIGTNYRQNLVEAEVVDREDEVKSLAGRGGVAWLRG